MLERQLRRIAREVEASGVRSGFHGVPNPEAIVGLVQLSDRRGRCWPGSREESACRGSQRRSS